MIAVSRAKAVIPFLQLTPGEDAEAVHAVIARGLARGSVFTRDGVLVASVAQEGLIRQQDTDYIVS